jgi:hypothetical protein
MTEIKFTIDLRIKFYDAPKEIATAFTEDSHEQEKLYAEVERVIEAFIRDYRFSYFDSNNLYDEVVKDLFRKTAGADPTAKIERVEAV